MEAEVLYCICRQPYDKSLLMIQCDYCQDWFHTRYVYYYSYGGGKNFTFHISRLRVSAVNKLDPSNKELPMFCFDAHNPHSQLGCILFTI